MIVRSTLMITDNTRDGLTNVCRRDKRAIYCSTAPFSSRSSFTWPAMPVLDVLPTFRSPVSDVLESLANHRHFPLLLEIFVCLKSLQVSSYSPLTPTLLVSILFMGSRRVFFLSPPLHSSPSPLFPSHESPLVEPRTHKQEIRLVFNG
jgi:hypothetical protein